jgi:ABC-type glycerol-3-phosphate transport system substrate-binding protein
MEGPSSNVIWYNAALFKTAGLDPSVDAVNHWTWGDFYANAAKLTQRVGTNITVAGFDGVAANVNNLATLVQSDGASMYDAQQTAVGWDNEAGIETLQFIADINSGKWPGQATWAAGQKPPVTKNGRVFDGTVAMQLGGTFQVEFLESGASALDLRMALMPRGPHGAKNSSVSFTNMITLPVGSKHPDAAWTFASYFAGLEARTICLQTTQRAEQPRKDFFASQAFASMAQKFPDLQYVPQYGVLGGAYPFIQPTAVANAVNPILVQCAAGKQSATDAIRQAAQLANALLRQPS